MAGQFCCWEYQVWLYHCWEAVGKIQYGFWDYCRGYLCLYWPGVQGKVLGMETVCKTLDLSKIFNCQFF